LRERSNEVWSGFAAPCGGQEVVAIGGGSTSSSYVYAEHVDRNLNRTLELREISHHLFKVQASILILANSVLIFFWNDFVVVTKIPISIWSTTEYEET
jgi:hypothetical protein